MNMNESIEWTPLMAVASHGHTDAVKTLIAKGADVNAQDKYGRSALSLAAEQEQIETIKALITAGADVNAQPESGRMTALMCAAEKGCVNSLKMLIEALRADGALAPEDCRAWGANIEAQDEYGQATKIDATTASACAVLFRLAVKYSLYRARKSSIQCYE